MPREKWNLDDPPTQQLGQVDAVAAQSGIKYGLAIQDTLADLLARKAVGGSLLTYLDKEASTCPSVPRQPPQNLPPSRTIASDYPRQSFRSASVNAMMRSTSPLKP
jgi:hypothetical protein